jgi:hypothetical protein
MATWILISIKTPSLDINLTKWMDWEQNKTKGPPREIVCHLYELPKGKQGTIKGVAEESKGWSPDDTG